MATTLRLVGIIACGLLPRFVQVVRAGQFLGENGAEEQTDHKSGDEEVVKVFAEHVKSLGWEHTSEVNVLNKNKKLVPEVGKLF